MGHLNVEIKAHCDNQEKIRDILKEKRADFKGIDHQVDTYFNVRSGRLKLREGNIENSLIFYDREEKKGPKESKVILLSHDPKTNLKEILVCSLGVVVEVDKQRAIYFLDNVKFHIDKVKGLGNFIEIEAIDKNGTIGTERLHEQCRQYLNLFNVAEKDLISSSYSDLLLKKSKT